MLQPEACLGLWGEGGGRAYEGGRSSIIDLCRRVVLRFQDPSNSDPQGALD